jgi:hypothetical protein
VQAALAAYSISQCSHLAWMGDPNVHVLSCAHLCHCQCTLQHSSALLHQPLPHVNNHVSQPVKCGVGGGCIRHTRQQRVVRVSLSDSMHLPPYA